jgi:hypothetical protein
MRRSTVLSFPLQLVFPGFYVIFVRKDTAYPNGVPYAACFAFLVNVMLAKKICKDTLAYFSRS